MSTLVFLRHGKTRIDPTTPISQWQLSDAGLAQTRRVAQESVFDDVEVVVSSTEQKAIDTARPFAERLGKEIITVQDLSELDRDAGGFMDPETYERTAKQCLENPETSVNNWETASHALARFSRAVEKLEHEYPGKKILIVGHGYTINMYFAEKLGKLHEVYKRLDTNDFCDWGVVQNGVVVTDLGAYKKDRAGERFA